MDGLDDVGELVGEHVLQSHIEVPAMMVFGIQLAFVNAFEPMLVTELGIIIDTRLVQSLNALSPMLVTESGIIIDTRLVQPRNAP